MKLGILTAKNSNISKSPPHIIQMMKASLKSSPKYSISSLRIDKKNFKEKKTSSQINSKRNLINSVDNNLSNYEIKPHHRKSINFNNKY